MTRNNVITARRNSARSMGMKTLAVTTAKMWGRLDFLCLYSDFSLGFVLYAIGGVRQVGGINTGWLKRRWHLSRSVWYIYSIQRVYKYISIPNRHNIAQWALELEKVTKEVDNNSWGGISGNSNFYEYLKEFVTKKLLHIQHVLTSSNLADAFTKPLLPGNDASHHGYFVSSTMGVVPPMLSALLHDGSA